MRLPAGSGIAGVLIVMSQSRSTARWAAQPIRLGLPSWSSLVVRPLVLGPDNVPVIADEAEAARDVTLAVFSAITHGEGPDAAAVPEPLAAVLETVNPETASVFAELVESGLVDAQAKKVWRELMMPVNYIFKNPVAVKLREEGRVEERIAERVASILRTLDRRHIEVRLGPTAGAPLHRPRPAPGLGRPRLRRHRRGGAVRRRRSLT